MTIQEFATAQLNHVEHQVEKSVEGIEEARADQKACGASMSFREQFEHLCEVYTACGKMLVGEKHEWGTFSAEGKSWDELKALRQSLRKAATDKIDWNNSEHLDTVSFFLVGHDNYHVGQLVTARLAHEPSWNMYSIYPG